ncbi:hypothetical protein BBH88_03360 [Planococcus antarcticus DSM 14505]|uniref:ATP-binding protein n=1 Tax=Planococcus antarcticus DSM 14505 TaxID=1185653 RepID=A0ABM6D2A4_9BACL|nr:hypothetical protein [Planococcus antarcticus]ANU09414.1 hypothetical protein BBH88_03360 [Planococcus antarcticus DSM 14505]
MSSLTYIAGTLIAPNIAGYILSSGLTNREEKKLIKEIEDKINDFNQKFNDTEVDSNHFVHFLEQDHISIKIIQRIFNAYNVSREDLKVITKELGKEAVEFVNYKKAEYKHIPIKQPDDFEEYFSKLFDTLIDFRESLLSIKDKAFLSMVDESISKSEGNITKTIEEKFGEESLLGNFQNLDVDERIKLRLMELNQEYKAAFIPLESGLINRKEFSMCRETIDSGNSLIIHGKAGRGKSGCTLDIINFCEEKALPYLAIKLDKRIPSKTAEKWGGDLGLPASVTYSIHSVSKNERAVIILDQLDVLRWTMAHSRDALLVCAEIINQVKRLNIERENKISIVFVCRTHDLENDNNIKSLFKKGDLDEEVIQWSRVQVNELDEDLVKSTVGKRYEQLTSKLKDMLKIPSNLFIWQQLDPTKIYEECATASHLVSEWWKQLSYKCFEYGLEETNLIQIKDKMVTFLERTSRIFIPLTILNENKSSLEFLSSNAFLIIHDNKVSFAHQSILDCFLAEKMLKRYYEGEDVIDIIGSKEKQTPGRRYQVQMFMQNLYEFDSQDFINAGQRIFEAKQIRHFVKFVFLEVLNQIENPDENIKYFIVNNCENEIYNNPLINNVIYSRPKYIRLLREYGILDKWLNDPSKKELVIKLLVSMSPNFETDDIDFIKKYLFNSQEDDNKLSKFFMYDINQDTDELFELRMKFYNRSPQMADMYLDLKSMLKKCEIRSIRLLAFLLENKIKSKGRIIYKYEEEFLYEDSEIFINNGEEVLNLLMPYIPTENEGNLLYSDWSEKTYHKGSLERACIQIIKKANAAIIGQEPEKFLESYKEFLGKGYYLFNEIILDGLYRLPERYSDFVITYLYGDLNSNIFDKTSGNGDELFIAKQILKKHSKYCSENNFTELEEKIVRYVSPKAKDSYMRRINYNRERNGNTVYWSFWGDFQKEILEVLPDERISNQRKDLIRTLSRKFSNGTTLYKYFGVSSGSVSSPVARKKLSNKNWIEIVTNSKINHKSPSRWKEGSGGIIDNSIEEFARSFGDAASEEPERMINIALLNKDKIMDVYIDFLFSGVAYSKYLDNVPEKLLEKMMMTFSYDYMSHRANYICSIIRNKKNVKWSQAILGILKDIAVNHENPEIGKPNITSRDDKEMCSFDMLQSNAINCVRGNAAQAIEQLLWNESMLFKQFKETIEQLTVDENPTVKLASIFALWPSYNIEKDWASEKILNLYEQDHRLAGFYDTKNMLFLLYPKYRERVLKVIEACYESEDEKIIEMGAFCLSEMFILKNEFVEVINNVDRMSEAQARGILQMTINYFNENKFNPLAKEIICEFKLSTLDLEVPISRLFYDNRIDLKRDKDFIIEIMNSRLSGRTVYAFVHYLEENSKSLVDYKDIIISMSYHLIKNSDSIVEDMYGIEDEISKLIIGLYDETSGSPIPDIKDIAKECLDIWDLMFEKQIGPIRSLSQQLMDR